MKTPICIGIILTGMFASALAQEPVLTLAPSPLQLPGKIGPLVNRDPPQRYSQPALGISYQYSAPGTSLTIYIYDGDQKGLADGPDTIPVCREFEFAKQSVMESYQNPKLVTEQLVRLLPPADAPLVREAVLEYQYREKQLVSYVWITAVARHFIKLRFSADVALRDELTDARRAILSALGNAIQPHLAAVDPKAEKPGTSIGLVLDADEDMAGSGILYTMFLSTAAEKTPDLVPVCGGELVPGYDTELSLYRGLFAAEDAIDKSRFSKQIQKIEGAGFLEEFVWVELHREAWGETGPEGLTLSEYRAWKKKNLKRFRRPQFGSVSVGHPRLLPLEPPAAH